MHTYTCLLAPEPLRVFGLNFIVAKTDTRENVSAFRDEAAAVEHCAALNKIHKVIDHKVEQKIEQKATVEVTKTPPLDFGK